MNSERGRMEGEQNTSAKNLNELQNNNSFVELSKDQLFYSCAKNADLIDQINQQTDSAHLNFIGMQKNQMSDGFVVLYADHNNVLLEQKITFSSLQKTTLDNTGHSNITEKKQIIAQLRAEINTTNTPKTEN